MPLRTDNTLISNREMIFELISKPFRYVEEKLEYLAVSNARTRALQEIAAIPEEELRAKNLTRADVARLTFHHDA